MWVPDPLAPGPITVDGVAVEADCASVEAGTACRVPVAGGASLAVAPGEGVARSTWTLALRPPPPKGALEEAETLREARRFEAALARLEAGPIPADRAGEAAHLRGRLLNATREVPGALAALDEAIAWFEAEGRTGEALTSRTLAAYLLAHQGDFEAADATRGAAPPGSRDLDARFRVAYSHAIGAVLQGDYRRSQRALEEATRAAARARDGRTTPMARDLYASVLSGVGDYEAAAALRDEIAAALPDDARCVRATALANLGWDRLQALEAGRPLAAADAEVAFARAAADLAGCPREGELGPVLQLNRALLALVDQEPGAAEAHLEAARPALDAPPLELHLTQLEIEARLALSSGDARGAHARFDRMHALAAQHGLPEAEWRALRGQARALRARGDVPGALAAYARAGDRFGAHSALVPAHEGRDRFLARWERTALEQVGLLLEEGRPTEALDTLRRFRSSYLRTTVRPADAAAWAELQARYAALSEARAALEADAWQRTAAEAEAARAAHDALAADARALLDQGLSAATTDALRPPAPGELLVAWAETGGRRWMLLGAAAGARAVDLGAVADPADWVGALGPHLEGVSVLTVLPTSAVRGVDLGALPLDGAPLAARVPLRWSLDLSAEAPAPPAVGAALVTVDPSSDLPAARAEAAALAPHLARAEVRARVLEGPDARREVVLAALSEVDLLHHAGHGAWTGDPWAASLVLADDARITAADVLAAPRVPAVVVLSSCEGARSPEGPLEAMGLAQAFVRAGSVAVIGATRPVQDEVAAVFASTLYEGGFSQGVEAAFQRAVLAARAHDPEGSDWAAFRLLTP